MRGFEEQLPPTVMCVQSGTVSVHPQGRLRLVVLVWGGKATSVGMANGETESLSLFVTQSFLLCSAAYSGIIAALFAPHTGLLHPLSYTLTSINTLGNLSQIYTQENLTWVMREFGVKSLAFCKKLFIYLYFFFK